MVSVWCFVFSLTACETIWRNIGENISPTFKTADECKREANIEGEHIPTRSLISFSFCWSTKKPRRKKSLAASCQIARSKGMGNFQEFDFAKSKSVKLIEKKESNVKFNLPKNDDENNSATVGNGGSR